MPPSDASTLSYASTHTHSPKPVTLLLLQIFLPFALLAALVYNVRTPSIAIPEITGYRLSMWSGETTWTRTPTPSSLQVNLFIATFALLGLVNLFGVVFAVIVAFAPRPTTTLLLRKWAVAKAIAEVVAFPVQVTLGYWLSVWRNRPTVSHLQTGAVVAVISLLVALVIPSLILFVLRKTPKLDTYLANKHQNRPFRGNCLIS